MKNKLSIIFMKVLRRATLKIQNWYRYYSLISGLKSFGEGISVKGHFNLWNDNVSIGDKVSVYPNVTFWGPGEIKVGNNVELGLNSTFFASEGIEIGDSALIAANCYIIDSNHGIEKDELIRNQSAICKGKVIIGEDAWLGAGVKVLSGVHIGKGAVIGAQALVNKDIPDYAIAVGVPAKVVGYRK